MEPGFVFLSTLSLRRATSNYLCLDRQNPISIHALLAESDRNSQNINRSHSNFYPRSPCGERLGGSGVGSWLRANFYPRSPCGERPVPGGGHISKTHFYPRSPCGERLTGFDSGTMVPAISIHALLAESDKAELKAIADRYDFYPRSPCGERLIAWSPDRQTRAFLSTLSLRRATYH